MIAVARLVLDASLASIWQGACIALSVAALLALGGYRLNARTRCIVLQAGLVAIAIVPLTTTLPSVISQASVFGVHNSADRSEPKIRAPYDAGLHAARRIDVALSDRTVLALTAAWLVGVALFSLRIVAGSLQVARLVKRSERVMSRGGVEILVSPDIGVPLAFGFATPVIIVPAALAEETEEAFECIVLHELAHVQRGDAYMNACERTIHVFLHFNPAAWLVLRAIAFEREMACDDWAVAQSRDLAAYTRSLASFAVRRANGGSTPAHIASGFGHATLKRVQRLEDGRRNGATTISHSALGGFTLVLLTIALTLYSFAPAIAFASQPTPSNAEIAATACPSSEVRYVRGPAPRMERHMPNGLKVLVHVRVSPFGKPFGAALYRTSGNPAFDAAVLTAAEKGVYAPEMRNCRPLAGSYLFEAMTG